MKQACNSPEGVSGIVSSRTSALGISGRRLQNVLKRYPVSVNVFTCIGSDENFLSEIAALRELGWAEENLSKGDKSQICLLVDATYCKLNELKDWLDGFPGIELILIHAETGTKKTPYLALLEERGFHIILERGCITFLNITHLNYQVIETGHRLGSHLIRLALEKSWRRIRNLDNSTSVELLIVSPLLLLLSDRFDIAIKALYARLWRQERAKEWREYAYKEHILRLTGPEISIIEYEAEIKSKVGLEHFLNTFHKLVANINSADIPVVPVDRDWCAYDGAHRIASAIAMNRDVRIARIAEKSESRASADFFLGKTHGHPPCPTDILDEAAIEYCRIKDGLVLALIFPTVVSDCFAIAQLEKMGRVVYRKDIVLSSKAGAALLRQVYLGHAWTETGGEDSGFAHKVKSCFPFRGTVRVVLLDGCDPRDIRPTKECIRAHYGIGNHAIHLTDGDDEVGRVARALFNKNSIDLLEAGVGQLPGFHHMLFAYRDWLEANALDDESFCIDGSAVLALLGLRECRDLDFVFDGTPSTLPAMPDRINCHNDLAKYHSHSIADLVGDPRLHCWYMGIKFCTPKVVLEMKEKRREVKDLTDAAMLRSKLPVEHAKLLHSTLMYAYKFNGIARAKFAALIYHVKKPVRPFVKMIRHCWARRK